MSILPEKFNNSAVVNRRDLAELDLPVPAVLADEREQSEWRIYAESLPLAKKIEKFGQAVDQAIASKGDQQVFMDKVMIAYTVLSTLSRVFEIETRTVNSESFNSDFSRAMHGMATFLKSVESPQAKAWEDRRTKWNAALPKIRSAKKEP